MITVIPVAIAALFEIAGGVVFCGVAAWAVRRGRSPSATSLLMTLALTLTSVAIGDLSDG